MFADDVSFKIVKVNVTPSIGTIVNQLHTRALANELLDFPGLSRHGLATSSSSLSDNLTNKTKNLRDWFSLAGTTEKERSSLICKNIFPTIGANYWVCVTRFEKSTSINPQSQGCSYYQHTCAVRVTSLKRQDGDWLNSCVNACRLILRQFPLMKYA